MANEVIIEFKADTSQLEPAILFYQKIGKLSEQDAEKITRLSQATGKNLSDAAEKAAGSFQKLNKEAKDAGQTIATKLVLDKSKDVAKTIDSVASLRTQIKQAVQETALLTEKFGALDPRTKAAAANAAVLRDRMKDVNASIQSLDPDAKFGALIQVTRGASGALFAAQGAMQLFGLETSTTKGILDKFGGALYFAQGLNQLGGLKDAFTNVKLALGISKVSAAAFGGSMSDVADESISASDAIDTAAKTTQTYANSTKIATDATRLATVAQTQLNVAVLANPYVIAIAAVIALSAAFILLASDSEKVSTAVDDLNDSLDYFNDVSDSLDRINKEQHNQAQTDIELMRLKGATRKQLTDAEVKDRNQSIADLQQKNKMEEDQFEQNSILIQKIGAKKKELTEEEKKSLDRANAFNAAHIKNLQAEPGQIQAIKNEIKVIRQKALSEDEQDQKASYEKADALRKAFNDKRARVQKDFIEMLKDIEISLIDNQYDKQRAEQKRKFEKDQDDLADNLDHKLVTLAQYNEGVIALQKKLEHELEKINKSESDANTSKNVFHPNREDFEKGNKILVDAQKEADAKAASEVERQEKIKKALREEILMQSIQGMEAIFSAGIDNQISSLEKLKDAQNKHFDDQLSNNQNRRDRDLISDREYRAEQKKILEEKTKAEELIQKRINDAKRKADIANRAEKLFDIAIATARNIVEQPFAAGLYAALGAIQAGIILATPLPKYHSGKLAKGLGNEEIAIIRDDETITNPQKSKEYGATLSAIHHGAVPAFALNDFVKNFTVKDVSRGTNNSYSSSTNIDYDKLASAIAWELRGAKNVNVNGFGELIAAVRNANADPRYLH